MSTDANPPLTGSVRAAANTPGHSRRRLIDVACLSTYVVCCLALLPLYIDLIAKDEVNYISIGEKFARGDLAHAPNAYFNPALPLLLVPFLLTGLPSVLAARLLMIATGAFTFWSVRALLSVFDIGDGVRIGVLLVLIPILVAYTLSPVTPDLLLIGVLTRYFAIVFSARYTERPGSGWASGALGAAAYLSKGFAFPFFLLHFAAMTGLRYVIAPRERRALLVKFAQGLVVLLCITAVWVVLLQRKYRDPAVAIGITGAYNFAIRGPDIQPLGAPSSYGGFVEPPVGAVSVWEEPYYYYKRTPGWSPLDSRRAFVHQLELVRTSVENIWTFLNQFTVFWSAIVLSGVLWWRRGRPSGERTAVMLSLVTLAVYTAPYAALYSELRYFWPVGILLLILGAWSLERLFESGFLRTPAERRMVGLALALSFVIHPMWELIRRVHDGAGLAAIGRELEAAGLQGSRLASDSDFGGSVVVAYSLGARYYGHPKPGMSWREVVDELHRHQVQYYLCWRAVAPDDVSLREIKMLRGGERRLVLYAVVPRTP